MLHHLLDFRPSGGSGVKLRRGLGWERYVPWGTKGTLLLAVTELVFDVILQLLLGGLQLPRFLLLKQTPGILEWVPE